MDLNQIALDLNKEVDGVWEQLDTKTSIRVARMYNPRFVEQFEKLTAPHRRAAKNGILDEELSANILSTVIGHTILVDWKGLTENGVEVPYTPEKSAQIMADPRLKQLRAIVVQIAEDQARFREEEITETAGKSEPSSSGTSSGASTKASSKK